MRKAKKGETHIAQSLLEVHFRTLERSVQGCLRRLGAVPVNQLERRDCIEHCDGVLGVMFRVQGRSRSNRSVADVLLEDTQRRNIEGRGKANRRGGVFATRKRSAKGEIQKNGPWVVGVRSLAKFLMWSINMRSFSQSMRAAFKAPCSSAPMNLSLM
jgi:hypothetical protein